jgi:hypothetical protein
VGFENKYIWSEHKTYLKFERLVEVILKVILGGECLWKRNEQYAGRGEPVACNTWQYQKVGHTPMLQIGPSQVCGLRLLLSSIVLMVIYKKLGSRSSVSQMKRGVFFNK